MNIESKVKFSGVYTLKKINKHGDEVDLGKHKNLLTNNFYEYIDSSVGDLFNRCYVGTGTTPPTLGDNYLENSVADTTSKTSLSAVREVDEVSETIYEEVGVRFVFSIGAINTNITEIGIRNRNTPFLSTRSLIVDEFGNPSSVSVESGEQLIVEYRLKVEDIPMSGVNTLNLLDKNGGVIQSIDVTHKLMGGGFDAPTSSSYKIGNNDWYGNAWCPAKAFNSLAIADSGLVINPQFGLTPEQCGYPSSVSSTSVSKVSGAANYNDGLSVRYRIGTTNGNQPGGFSDMMSWPYGGLRAGIFWNLNFSSPIAKTSEEVFEFEITSKITEV